MIEITKDQCTRMLVWDDDENSTYEADVFSYLKDVRYPYHIVDKDGYTQRFKHAKPLPESPKEQPMTALDVMWWENNIWSKDECLVVKRKDCEEFDNCLPEFDGNNGNFDDYEFNFLIRENGETKLKHKEWKEFTFTNCNMEEE